MNDRIPRLQSLLQQELNQAMLTELEFPEGVLATIVGVKVDDDVLHAQVRVSVYPETARAEAMRLIEAGRGEVSKAVARRLRHIHMPKLHFVSDFQEEKADHILRVLDRLD
jgi:ribosome-binding factor A